MGGDPSPEMLAMRHRSLLLGAQSLTKFGCGQWGYTFWVWGGLVGHVLLRTEVPPCICGVSKSGWGRYVGLLTLMVPERQLRISTLSFWGLREASVLAVDSAAPLLCDCV